MDMIHLLGTSGIDLILSFVIIFRMKKLRGIEIKELPNDLSSIHLGTAEQKVELAFLNQNPVIYLIRLT